ncbi:MAG: hypothetical protein V3T77_08260, partial [Planctomycetota bacterium]
VDKDGNRGQPMFSQVRENGEYSKKGLASGKYQIVVRRWSEDQPVIIQGPAEPDAEVELKPGETLRVDFPVR